MRNLKTSVCLALLATAWGAHAAGAPAAKSETPAFTVNFDAASGPAPVDEKPFPLVLGWLAQNVPECPPAVAPEIAAKFVEQLALRHPGEAERLGKGEVPLAAYESLLWQAVATRLSGAAYETRREAFAIRRVTAVAGAQGADATRAAAAVSRLKNESTAAYRRLAEGRMEDEEVVRLPGLAAERDPAREAAAIVAKPRILSAQEIVGEFARRNQTGAAAARLQAYQLEARLKNPDGLEQKIRLFKLRPDRFRIHVQATGGDTVVVAFDGTRYWHQAGTKIEALNPAALGSLRYFSEFLDPLFGAEGLQFTRLDDQMVDGRKCYQVRVQRADGSAYSALLDQENFRQLARDNPDGTKARFSDFRDFAGLTLAHRETLVLANGTSVVLDIIHAAANPGLIGEFFQPPSADRLDLAPIERLLAGANPP